MKFLILSVCVALAAADVSHVVNDEAHANILKQSQDTEPNGNFQYEYETQNGISGSAVGTQKEVGLEAPAQEIQGQNSWTAPDGQQISIQYVANENGYQPQGSAIPTPPPIPEAILRALQYIQDHPQPVDKTIPN